MDRRNVASVRSKLTLPKQKRNRNVQTEMVDIREPVTSFQQQLRVVSREVEILKQFHQQAWDCGQGSITPQDVDDFTKIVNDVNALADALTSEGVTPSQSKHIILASCDLILNMKEIQIH